MRRILLILCSLLVSVMLAHGGNIKEVRLHFDASDFTLTQENGVYSISLNENTLFMGKNIIVGKNVKRGAIPGSVRILNGDVTFQAEQGVTIKDNFNVKKGASLKIQTNH